MFNRIIRNSIVFTAWVILAIGCMLINGTIALANYLGCRGTFELLNYEISPLGGDGLLGMLFQVFLREATICNLFALSLNLAEIVGFFFLFHLALHTYDLYGDRGNFLKERARSKNRNEDEDADKYEENARLATQQIILDAILLALLILPMVWVIRWDLWLFKYRSLAALLGIDDPALAARTIKAIQLQGSGDLLAVFLARIGAWGYIAITAISCLGVEISFRRSGESWARLTNAIGDWYKGLGRGQQNGNTPDMPNPNPADGDGNQERDTTPSATNPPETSSDTEPETGGEEEPQPVMGGGPGEKVTLSHAIGHPERYWVDIENREIWDADYRKELMGN